MSEVLQVTGLKKRYGGFQLDIPDFHVEAGTVTGLVGANGAGKSTTIKLSLGLIRRDEGTIRVFGLDNRKDESAVKQEIGVVFDEPCFHELLTPLQIGRTLSSWYAKWDDALYRDYLQKFGLPAGKPFKEFSRGMKMKLSIATAMCHHPRLLLLDEPTGGLDPLVRDEILDMFLEFLQEEDHSIILSSHITSDLDKIADTIALIDHGKLLFHEEKDALRDGYSLIKGSAEQLAELDRQELVGVRENRFGFEALCRREIARRHPGLASERPDIEQIMLFFTRRPSA